jgi:hypothetical protein
MGKSTHHNKRFAVDYDRSKRVQMRQAKRDQAETGFAAMIARKLGMPPPSPIKQPHARSISRRTTVRACIEEITYGDSIVKLYASLLVRALLDAEPRLKREFQWKLDDMRI